MPKSPFMKNVYSYATVLTPGSALGAAPFIVPSTPDSQSSNGTVLAVPTFE